MEIQIIGKVLICKAKLDPKPIGNISRPTSYVFKQKFARLSITIQFNSRKILVKIGHPEIKKFAIENSKINENGRIHISWPRKRAMNQQTCDFFKSD